MSRRTPSGFAFVPRFIFGTVFAGVVPACARHATPNGLPPGTIVLAIQAFSDVQTGVDHDATAPSNRTDARPPSPMTVADAGFHPDGAAPRDAGTPRTRRGRRSARPATQSDRFMLGVAVDAFDPQRAQRRRG